MTDAQKPQRKRPTEQGLETVWKWILRGLGLVGFVYLLVINPNVPGYFYVLLGGLLGLPNVLAYQFRVNRERDGERRGGERDPR